MKKLSIEFDAYQVLRFSEAREGIFRGEVQLSRAHEDLDRLKSRMGEFLMELGEDAGIEKEEFGQPLGLIHRDGKVFLETPQEDPEVSTPPPPPLAEP